MIVAVPKETLANETRVSIIPDRIPEIKKIGFDVYIETGAGINAGFSDLDYENKGGIIIKSRKELFTKSDVITQVMTASANPGKADNDYRYIKSGQIIIGFMNPLENKDEIIKIAKTGASCFAMELIPRITRAQAMDALSSMANLAGYKSVLIGANNLPRVLPMMTTAAGTMQPAKVFIVGVGVAGLQAIATAKRLGSVVSAYDVRPAVKEQVQSLNAKFIELELDTKEAEDKGGYAKALGKEFYEKQRELMGKVVAESDIVITTAAVPGGKSPILVTKSMVEKMHKGSILIDIAAEKGGNCELTKLNKTVVHNNVTIMGPANIPASIPFHASQMYSKNISSFLRCLVDKEGKLAINKEDEVIKESLLTENGEVVNPRVKDFLKI